jgi:hypothetical protein
MFHLPTKHELDTLADDKIRQIYTLAEKMPDMSMQVQFLGSLRHRLRVLRPVRRVTALRLFCLPFEALLCNETPRRREFAMIPRSVILPLWHIVLSHLDDRNGVERVDAEDRFFTPDLIPDRDYGELLDSYAGAVEAIRMRLERDKSFVREVSGQHRDFPDLIEEIHALYQMRDGITTARRQILAAEELMGASGDYMPDVIVLARTAVGAQGDLRRFRLFFLALTLDPDLAAHVDRLIAGLVTSMDAMAVTAIADDFCEAFLSRESEQVARCFSAPLETPTDLDKSADQILATSNTLSILRHSADRVSRPAVKRLSQAEQQLRTFLKAQFIDAAERNVTGFTASDPTALPSDTAIRDLERTVQALAKVRPAMRDMDLERQFTGCADDARAAVRDHLGRVMASHRAGDESDRQNALSIATQVACCLEPISNDDAVLDLLEECAGKLGLDRVSDRTQFLLMLVRVLNTDHSGNGAAASGRTTMVNF